MNSFSKIAVCLAALLSAATVCTQAVAETASEETVLYAPGQTPSDDELRQILFGDPNGVSMQTRGIVMQEAITPPVQTQSQPAIESASSFSAAPVVQSAIAASASIMDEVSAPKAPTTSAKANRSVAFNIEFGFNSATLPAGYQDQLASLAKALKSAEAEGKTVLIVGHTDTVGTEKYNEELSLRRAIATREILVKRYNVPAARLAPIGRGMSAPLVGVNGDAAQNRRVEFQTVN